jgi:cytochrome c biogenesis factor
LSRWRWAVLVNAFVQDDFSVRYVAENSNSALPLFYRVTRSGARTRARCCCGSLVLGGWTMAVVARLRYLPALSGRAYFGVLGLISFGFLLFTLCTSNPFARLLPAVPDGNDLNPVLQDFALAMHPPILYTGYVGFAVSFAFACAAMIEGRRDQLWARWMRPWTVIAWAFLAWGIALGSWWAYYELGLGRLLVLGSGRERLLHALAGRHCADSFDRGHGAAWPVQELDAAAGGGGVLAQSARHLPGALGRAGVGAFIRRRSAARHLHPRLS